jgi:hypothetical protein
MKIYVEDGVVLSRTNFSELMGVNFLCLDYHHRVTGIAHEGPSKLLTVAVVGAIHVSYCVSPICRREADKIITRDVAKSP